MEQEFVCLPLTGMNDSRVAVQAPARVGVGGMEGGEPLVGQDPR